MFRKREQGECFLSRDSWFVEFCFGIELDLPENVYYQCVAKVSDATHVSQHMCCMNKYFI